jgi:CRP-like cAMP-binding protein
MFGGRQGRFTAEAEREFAIGEDIVREGDLGSQMYIIQRGRVSVLKLVGEQQIELAELRKGDFFGEMSLLEGLPRSATVRAIEPTSVLVVEPGGFLLKIRRDPTLAFELLQQLSGRVRRLNEQLAETMLAQAQSQAAVDLSMTRTEFEAAAERSS